MKAPSLDFRKIAVTTPSDLELWAPEVNHVDEFGLRGHAAISRERYMLWTRDLHHWIQQRSRFIKMCGSIVTTLAISPSHPSALELWALEINHISWVWLAWVNSCGNISRTPHATYVYLWTWDLHHWIQQRLKFVQLWSYARLHSALSWI